MSDRKDMTFDIHAQEATTVRLLDGHHVSIEQEDADAHGGIVYVHIRGPANLDQLIAALQKCREVMQ